MNRQLTGKQGGEASESSPLSLLVHAAEQRPAGAKAGTAPASGVKADAVGSIQLGRGGPESEASRGAAGDANIEEQMRQAAAFRAEAALQQQQGLFSQLSTGDSDIYQQALLAAHQQQQVASLALATDIRSAIASAQLRAAQFGTQDLALARVAALQQQLGLGGGGRLESLQQEIELQRLEELERQQLLAAAAGSGASLGSLSTRQQLELQAEAQLRQEQLDQMGANNAESLLERANIRGAGSTDSAPPSRPAASETSSTKDTFQKTPGSVVVPCRARGMPMDHNFKTAYFVIPENVEHGEELICSYFACRNAGIKFRYCTHCKVPVAKRNFRKRHKHGKANTAGEADDEASNSGDEAEAPMALCSATGRMRKPHAKTVEDIESRKLPVEEPFVPVETKVPSPKTKPKPINPPVVEHVEKKPVAVPEEKPKSAEFDPVEPEEPEPPTSIGDGNDISADRERLWSLLLKRRPPTKDGEAVSAWLMEVLSVSDLETPLGQTDKAVGGLLPSGAADLTIRPAPTVGAEAAAQLAAASKEWAASQKSPKKEDSGPIPTVYIKKKRPLPTLHRDTPESEGSSKNGGSYLDWKKKHKGLPKKGAKMNGSIGGD